MQYFCDSSVRLSVITYLACVSSQMHTRCMGCATFIHWPRLIISEWKPVSKSRVLVQVPVPLKRLWSNEIWSSIKIYFLYLLLHLSDHKEICDKPLSLQWRHNGHDGLSNHQPHHCLLHRLFRCRSKKTSKLRVTGLCVGNSPVTGEFPAQRASNAENVSIWWRHHVWTNACLVYPRINASLGQDELNVYSWRTVLIAN